MYYNVIFQVLVDFLRRDDHLVSLLSFSRLWPVISTLPINYSLINVSMSSKILSFFYSKWQNTICVLLLYHICTSRLWLMAPVLTSIVQSLRYFGHFGICSVPHSCVQQYYTEVLSVCVVQTILYGVYYLYFTERS